MKWTLFGGLRLSETRRPAGVCGPCRMPPVMYFEALHARVTWFSRRGEARGRVMSGFTKLWSEF